MQLNAWTLISGGVTHDDVNDHLKQLIEKMGLCAQSEFFLCKYTFLIHVFDERRCSVEKVDR